MSEPFLARIDLDLAWRVEEACLNAWPATRTMALGGWLVRLSDGPTRRTDSANPQPGSPFDPTGIVEEVTTLFAERGRAPLFRIPGMASAADQPLTRLGFAPPEGETSTLYASSLGSGDLAAAQVSLTSAPDEDWLRARAHFTEADQGASAAYARMLGLIVGPRRFAASSRDGRIVSIAYGVLSRGLLVIESVATAPEARRAGLALQTVGALMAWAANHNIDAACLQVVTDNAPARALYQTLGFSRELYRYHYRRGKTPS